MTHVIDNNRVGGKARNLSTMVDLGMNVPKFITITEDQILHLGSLRILEILKEEIENASVKRYAVRSSANIEDGMSSSFAGLFDTVLNVRYKDLDNAIMQVLASRNSDQVRAYLQAKNIDTEIHMAIIIQEMIDADVSGVAFSQHIDKTKTGKLINAVYGLGEALVSGEVIADEYIVSDQRIEHKIATKSKALLTNDSGGSTWHPVGESRSNVPCMSDVQIITLAEQIDKLTDAYGHEVDVEFAIQNDELFILQVRPITIESSGNTPAKTVWDNSNIIESYPGITSPLTFSFIKDMYGVVYKQFASILGVPQTVLAKNDLVFGQMLGHLNGRVYYNLRSWYTVLAMLPGYRINAPFMEKMMGVKESFDLETDDHGSKSKAWRQSLLSVIRLVVSFLRLKRQSLSFLSFSNKIISKYKSKAYSAMPISQIREEYHAFEKVLAYEWKAPLINDFFAMIFFGVLSKWTTRLVPDQPQCINDLLIGSQDIISVLPMKQSIAIAKAVNANENHRKLFLEDNEVILAKLREDEFASINEKIQKYINDFGDRCPEELKLETRTYTQNPELFIALIKSYLDIDLEKFDHQNTTHQRNDAERACIDALKGTIFKKHLFRWVLAKTRYLISNRENLRFQRTKGYSVVRIMFDAIGSKLYKEGVIGAPLDIYLLTKDEIFAVIEGTCTDTDLRSTISRRKSQQKDYRALNMKDRIVTTGIVQLNDMIDHSEKFRNSELKGTGCCPGIVEAKVTVIHDPLEVHSLDNTIMVARFTDPGWVRLFPSAAGILVEKGSLLSHSAIVARELGIPCIVAVDGLLDTLSTGDHVLMDGSTGAIKMLSSIQVID